EEKKLRKVPRFANACGAITTTKKGAIPALPSDSEALSFIKDHQRPLAQKELPRVDLKKRTSSVLATSAALEAC
ncbi:unnamed protein product, partial [Brassica rapa subsp. trilocularis]